MCMHSQLLFFNHPYGAISIRFLQEPRGCLKSHPKAIWVLGIMWEPYNFLIVSKWEPFSNPNGLWPSRDVSMKHIQTPKSKKGFTFLPFWQVLPYSSLPVFHCQQLRPPLQTWLTSALLSRTWEALWGRSVGPMFARNMPKFRYIRASYMPTRRLGTLHQRTHRNIQLGALHKLRLNGFSGFPEVFSGWAEVDQDMI